MKVLVTGADGFIGSHLTEALVHNGHDVRALSQYNSINSNGWLDSLPDDVLEEVDIVPGDVRDRSQMMTIIRGRDVVLHLAALIAIPYSYQAPQSYIDTNITGTLNVLEAVRLDGNAQLIHTSTSEVYGSALFVPITEDHPLRGQSPYSASKIAADQLVYAYYSSFGLPATTIRPFNTYGPRQSQRAVIPAIISQLISGVKTIELGALTPTRDFNFIDDTVQGYIKALSADNIFGTTINLGSGFEISIGETAELITKIMNYDVEVVSSEVRMRPKDSEVDRLLAANERAKDLLDWTPEFGGLQGFRRGLEATISWFSNPENMKRYAPTKYIV